MTYLCGMKHRLTTLILALMAACQVAAQTITGIVTDGRQPLTGANVFVMGTIDGCLTDTLGRFSFQVLVHNGTDGRGHAESHIHGI